MDRNFKHSKGGYGILPRAILYNINRKYIFQDGLISYSPAWREGNKITTSMSLKGQKKNPKI